MGNPVLIPAAKKLREEFNTIAPERDTESDGWVGDSAHAGRSSDHNPDESGATPDEDSDSLNEVHAVDVDKDLRRSGVTMQNCVDTILARCRKNNSDPQNEPRLKYIIFNRYIWEAPNWTKKAYTGENPHDKHAHFSFEYDSQYSEDTSPWGLVAKYGKDDDMPTAAEIAKAVWDHQLTDPSSQTGGTKSAGAFQRYPDVLHNGTRDVTTDATNDLMARIGLLPAETAAAVDALPDAGMSLSDLSHPSLSADAIADSLRAVLTPDKLSAVVAALSR
jgi:hypothetical protein